MGKDVIKACKRNSSEMNKYGNFTAELEYSYSTTPLKPLTHTRTRTQLHLSNLLLILILNYTSQTSITHTRTQLHLSNLLLIHLLEFIFSVLIKKQSVQYRSLGDRRQTETKHLIHWWIQGVAKRQVPYFLWWQGTLDHHIFPSVSSILLEATQSVVVS